MTPVETYNWKTRSRFLNRSDELARLVDWWKGRDQNALALYGRRRVGKSWLFRAFADQKPALVLVAERRATGAQLDRFAEQLEPHLGVRPDLPDLAALFRVLYRLADTRTLVVIDEFPYLLPTRKTQMHDVLTAVQAVIEEERDDSELKLVLCGSHIAQMQGLLAEGSPIRGRLTPLSVAAMSFAESQDFLSGSITERIERYSVSGGMATYLSELGSGGSLADLICKRVIDPRASLFNDPREVLEEEFNKPGTYFSLLEELAHGEAGIADLAQAVKRRTSDLTPYLEELDDMRLVRTLEPTGTKRSAKRYRLADPFLAFWFHFVFGFQDDLEAGLAPKNLYKNEIASALPGHTAALYEQLCQEYVRTAMGMPAGSWWGKALPEHRQDGSRMVEEIDVVGTRQGRVEVLGECKWTNAKLGFGVLRDLEEYKLPALRKDGGRIAKDVRIALFSKAGFKQSVLDAAAERTDIDLIDLGELERGLLI